MLGFFVYHSAFKTGKIVSAGLTSFTVIFFQDQSIREFEKTAFDEGELTRATLPPGTECSTPEGECRIQQILEPLSTQSPVVYLVTKSDGLQSKINETELQPTTIIREDPITSLCALQQEGYTLFASRNELLEAVTEVVRQGGGLTALLSSRIDIRPHQAYVAGVILQDHLRRYILADEVGLGKTIEAGIVMQDLLSSRPMAKVLVLCPGALTQQWLCEFYAKFSTRVFTLLDLHPTPETLSTEQQRTVIAPLHAINGPHSKWLNNTLWDLVIVDEVHHLLTDLAAYNFVRDLSTQVGSILLLSAIPAQQRKTEFLQLLELLEPTRYTGTPPEDFDRLYDAQTDIGRELRRLRGRLKESSPDVADIKGVVAQILAISALQKDQILQVQGNALLVADEGVQHAAQLFLATVADRSRINRRIIKNRRERLVEDGLVEKTTRKFLPTTYDPGQPEIDALQASARLVRKLYKRLDDVIWSAFARVVVQSLAHPETAAELFLRLELVSPDSPQITSDLLGHLAGSSGWATYRDSLLKAARSHLTEDEITKCVDAVEEWRDSQTGLARVDALVNFVGRLRFKKIVIFAGYPGLMEHLVPALCEAFDSDIVCEFRGELSQEDKEANVERFRTDPDAVFLVSDESGGEGRNFQFAEAVIHYDTPWYVSRIEQRIGRLDRIGRTNPEVTVGVLFGLGTLEEEFVTCLEEGFGVYERSVSGLEFALRELELGLVSSLLGSDRPELDVIISELRANVEEHRSQNESEAILDESSFNREIADRYRRSNTLNEAELRLERAFSEFIRKVATGNSAREKHDSEFSKGIWEFEVAQFQHIKVEFPNHSDRQQTVTPKGTFRRQIAQARLDLQFFSFGHPFFDGVIQAIRKDQCGRVYAVEVTTPKNPGWFGFEFVFLATPDLEPLKGNSGLLSRVSQVFTATPLHLFVSGTGNIELNGDEFLNVRRGLNGQGKDRTWWNLTKAKAPRVIELFGGQDQWRTAVLNTYQVAFAEAKRQFEERLGYELERVLATLAEQRGQTEKDNHKEFAGFVQLEQALRNWRVVLDGVGFLSLNNGLGKST